MRRSARNATRRNKTEKRVTARRATQPNRDLKIRPSENARMARSFYIRFGKITASATKGSDPKLAREI
jgi:hypothetical protein